MPQHTNHLAGQTSPYLLQHLHNPVDWWPWGEPAFAEARRRDVPIFLSIGYSTCYWCHVMERESFESEPIARLMNDRFVCIKVDREERPDVDDLYMAATQIMTGHGGWPMSCFLEPKTLRPYWCGTYFPPEPRSGMPAFPQVLEGMSHAWSQRRAEAEEQAASVAAAVGEQLAAGSTPVGIGLEQVSDAARALLRSLDRTHGGFGAAPKFPQPVFIELLLDVRDSAGDDATRDAADHAVRLTLDKMACGGMNDQVGGGFHRYSVDQRWLVPHFEKMLYDNAQLAALYARAGTTYDDAFYKRVAKRTLEYVLREMTSPEGGVYSAQDAEVDGREGANYVWTPDEVRAVLDGADAEFALKVYGLNDGPNFRDPHHPDAPATNILFLADRPEKTAAGLGLSVAEFLARLDRVNAPMGEARRRRKQPGLDDKVLLGWNGLMIGAMARAGSALGEPRFLKAAADAADFALTRLKDSTGDLRRSWRAGKAAIPAFLEDYAFLVDGLLALHAAGNERFLQEAAALAGRAAELFADGHGGYFDARAGQSDLFLRPRSSHDGALPSGSSTMLHNLLTLHNATHNPVYLESAIVLLRSLSPAIAAAPLGAANATRAILRIIAADPASAARLAGFGPAAAEPDDRSPPPAAEIYASTDRVQVGKDHPAEFGLVLRIKEGSHLTAADPGPSGAGLQPFRIGVVGGSGVAAYADYPAGEPYGPDGGLRVYRGTVEFRIAIERTGDWSGRPLLSATYQACTDTECLAPTTVELDVAIDKLD